MKKITLTMAGIVIASSMGAASTFAKGPHIQANAKAKAKSEQVKVEAKQKVSVKASATCPKVPPGHLIAPGYIKKHGKPVVLPCQILPPGIKNKLNGTSTPPAPTSTDTMAPVISGLAISAVGTSSATISWNTGEAATGAVFFNTSTPVGTSTSIGTTTLSTVHSFTLNGLAAGTTYRFYAESKDAAGNRTTTVESSFTTLMQDVTPPIVSNIALTKLDTTTARVDWTTNEVATGKVYHAATSSVDLATAPSVGTTTLSTNHSLTVSGLATGTVRTFVIESVDAFGNKTISTAGSLSF